MLPEIINIRKKIDQRRHEFRHMLDDDTPCSDIHSIWSFDLGVEIGDAVKWQAVWLMSEESCLEFKTMYPTSVSVRVQSILFEELSAVVIVEYIQDDIDIPTMLQVPLFELYPTKEQEEISPAVARHIADWLDRCRFFLLYLWYPWDSTENMTVGQWAQQHLENRLQLHYDIRNGVMDKSMAQYIEQLLTSSLQVVDAIEEEQEGMDTESDDYKLRTIRNTIKKEKMKLELSFFEVRELRGPMSDYIRERDHIGTNQSQTLLVMAPSSAASISQTLQSIGPNETLTLSSDPNQCVPTGSTIIFGPGTHALKDLGTLTYGGKIRGTSIPEDTVITAFERKPPRYMFLTSGGPMLYQNVTIRRNQGVILWVVEGVVRMENCHITAGEESQTRGVVVQPGARLELTNCILRNLASGILVKDGGAIRLESTCILGCSEGIKFLDKASVSLQDVNIEDCKSAGIIWETSSDVEMKETSGSLDILSHVQNVSISNCRMVRNQGKDVVIDHLQREEFME